MYIKLTPKNSDLLTGLDAHKLRNALRIAAEYFEAESAAALASVPACEAADAREAAGGPVNMVTANGARHISAMFTEEAQGYRKLIERLEGDEDADEEVRLILYTGDEL